MIRAVYDCEQCGKKNVNAKTLVFQTTSNSIDTVEKEFCIDCLASNLQILINGMNNLERQQMLETLEEEGVLIDGC